MTLETAIRRILKSFMDSDTMTAAQAIKAIHEELGMPHDPENQVASEARISELERRISELERRMSYLVTKISYERHPDAIDRWQELKRQAQTNTPFTLTNTI